MLLSTILSEKPRPKICNHKLFSDFLESSSRRGAHSNLKAKTSLSPRTRRDPNRSYTMYLSQSPLLALPILLLLTISTLTNFAYGSTPSLPLPSQVLYQFPNKTWVENLAVRSNGDLLVTLLTTPDLYLIPENSCNPTATLVYSFPSVLGLLGIAELEDDIFYVVAGNLSIIWEKPTVNTPFTYSIWEVDMRSFSSSGAGVRKVTDLVEAVFLNGLVALWKADSTILVADCAGLVWKVNVKSGAYSVAITDPTMLPTPNATLELGVNGLKIHDGYLYYTSSDQGLVCRVPISTSGNATGPVEVLATGLEPDDFDVDPAGKPWIAQNGLELVSVLLPNGTVVSVLGAADQLTVAGVTACVFGKGKGLVLHCCTGGGSLAPVNGTVTEGGKVVLIDREGF